MNASAIAAALAARAEDVCRHYLPGGRKQGRFWTAGDIDGTPGRSLYVRLAPPGTPGKWTDAATSEHGDLLDIVRRRSGAPTLGDALAEARRFLSLPVSTPRSAAPENYDSATSARRIWQRCKPIAGTHAEAYLQARGIHPRPLPALRFHPSLRYREQSVTQELPAMVAAVTDDKGTVRGIHRTWLDPRTRDKAPVRSPRKTLGAIRGLAVRLAPHTPGAPLVVGEGIETVLSVAAALPDTPAAAALAAGHLTAFTPPAGTSRLVIAADRDPEGEDAAGRLSRRCSELGIAAIVILPDRGDFNDDLRELGLDVLASRLRPLLPAA